MLYAPREGTGCACVCRKDGKGSECACGMCPEESPGRGSGSAPVNLRLHVSTVIRMYMIGEMQVVATGIGEEMELTCRSDVRQVQSQHEGL